MLTRAVLVLIQWLGYLPLPVVRALGAMLGLLLYGLVASRRRVVTTNLRLCFPHWSKVEVRCQTILVFIHFAQSWLDRGWLWYGPARYIRNRLQLTGALEELDGISPTVIFLPHFVGLDAVGMALTQQTTRRYTTIYTNQANAVSDAWILQGRQRFGSMRLFGRVDGVKPIVEALRKGDPLILLPDMNFGPEDSLFVPFYGVPAATVPSLSRFARLGRAKVVPILAKMTSNGYEIQVLRAWDNFPSGDLVADTTLMNSRLQSYIDNMPSQYYWVHKRFKDRPQGAPSVY
ncbi:MAG: lipid A biosynthesis acyltransferase [Burkholderiales bacterium]|nr:lipid A biosynthesis acyltransferase [Burkholderiales bacterium]